MRVQYIASAAVVIEHKGMRVLCDPWLTDGIYYGSWYHYPPLKFTPEDFASVDYIYVSHVHPDHMDLATLARLPKSIPVIIHDYAEKFLQRILVGLGFQKVIEVPHRQKIALGEDFSVEVLAADNCDAEICSKYWGFTVPRPYQRTMQIDSMAVFHGGGQTVVNTNDCPYEIAHPVCNYVLEKYKKVDFLAVGYSSASPYPQCFENLDHDTKLREAAVVRRSALNKAIQYVDHLRPAHFMPFAGQYVLGSELAKLNLYLAPPSLEDLPNLFSSVLREREKGHHANMVLLDSGEFFDAGTGKASASFTPADPEARRCYIDDVISKKTLLYQVGEFRVDELRRVDLTTRLREAQARMLRHQDHFDGYRSEWKIYLDTGQDYLYCVPFDGSTVGKAASGAEREPFIRVSVDYSLLNMILNRKAHWNNAEIGSHLRFYRQPDVYERAVHSFLSYFHC